MSEKLQDFLAFGVLSRDRPMWEMWRRGLPSLWTILRFLRQPPQPRCVEISPKQYRHGKPPSFAMLNQSRADLEISKESQFLELGIICTSSCFMLIILSL